MPDQVQRKSERTGGDTRTAARDDRAVERNARITEQARERLGIAQPVGLRICDPVVGQVAAARNMASAQAGPGFFGNAVEPPRKSTDCRATLACRGPAPARTAT